MPSFMRVGEVNQKQVTPGMIGVLLAWSLAGVMAEESSAPPTDDNYFLKGTPRGGPDCGSPATRRKASFCDLIVIISTSLNIMINKGKQQNHLVNNFYTVTR